MGRQLSWYIVSRNIEHDKSKQFCLDLEFEPESHEIDTKLFNIVNPNSKEINNIDYPIRADWIKAYQERKKEIREVCNSYKYDKKNLWCPKCITYVNGLYENSIDAITVGHSYSNSIWDSDWNVRYFTGLCLVLVWFGLVLV